MKKGFTLIELLAVIVLLGILALITIPVVLGMVNDSRKKAAISSAKEYVRVVEQSVVQQYGEKKFKASICEVKEDGNISCDDQNEYEINVDRDNPTAGQLLFEDKKLIKIVNLKFKKYYVNMNENGEYSVSTSRMSLD